MTLRTPALLRTLTIAVATAALACGAHAADPLVNLTLECTGGPDPDAVNKYRIDLYKRSVRMTKEIGGKETGEPVYLLDGKFGNAVKLIDDKLLLTYTNDLDNTFTIVLPVYGGAGNMKIGNVAGEKEHPNGYALTCARK